MDGSLSIKNKPVTDIANVQGLNMWKTVFRAANRWVVSGSENAILKLVVINDSRKSFFTQSIDSNIVRKFNNAIL